MRKGRWRCRQRQAFIAVGRNRFLKESMQFSHVITRKCHLPHPHPRFSFRTRQENSMVFFFSIAAQCLLDSVEKHYFLFREIRRNSAGSHIYNGRSLSEGPARFDTREIRMLSRLVPSVFLIRIEHTRVAWNFCDNRITLHDLIQDLKSGSRSKINARWFDDRALRQFGSHPILLETARFFENDNRYRE